MKHSYVRAVTGDGASLESAKVLLRLLPLLRLLLQTRIVVLALAQLFFKRCVVPKRGHGQRVYSFKFLTTNSRSRIVKSKAS